MTTCAGKPNDNTVDDISQPGKIYEAVPSQTAVNRSNHVKRI